MAREKLVRNICMGLFFFLSGVEYAVILPTLNGYLLNLGAEQYFLGLVMSAFSISGLIAAPIYGKITDRTKSTKLIVMIGNFFEIVGNILYLIGSNKYMILGARLIAGVGSGVASSIFGMITRTTSEKERTGTFALLMSLRQIGLIVGPAFNIFLHYLDFYIGHLNVNEFNSPGLLMTVIWLLHTLLLLIVYKDPEKGHQVGYTVVNEYEEIGEEERLPMPRSSSMLEDMKKKSFLKEFLRDEVIVCLAISFMVMFAQTGLETVTAPLSLLFFGWGGLQNSYLFCGASAVVVATFIVLGFLSKRYSDRSMMLAGCIGMLVTYVVFMVYVTVIAVHDYPSNPSWVFPIYIFDVVLLTTSLPFLWVPQAALFSKITSRETQAFNQGIRMMSMRFGQILGPVWASSLVTKERLPIMVGVDLFLMLLISVMVILSYKRLKPKESSARHVAENVAANGQALHAGNDSGEDLEDESAPLVTKSIN